jgi:thymidylate synthase
MTKNIDEQYQDLLQTILDHGIEKRDRTGIGTKSIFGYTIRHNMQEGFPALTTKKLFFKGVVGELIWFLRGDTNLRYLLENGIGIWTGDAYKAYKTKTEIMIGHGFHWPLFSQEEFIELIKTDDDFNKMWGGLGPIYGHQWKNWNSTGIDQIANLIQELKTNPDSRRLMVSAWNPGEIDSMVLPPCHYGFQCYTRELSSEERMAWMKRNPSKVILPKRDLDAPFSQDEFFKPYNVPTRAISLIWNQRSVDTLLGLPFNIASYALLLEIIAREVDMMPDQLIGNLGDTHLYLNHLEAAIEQIGRFYTIEELEELHPELAEIRTRKFELIKKKKYEDASVVRSEEKAFLSKIHEHTRQPFPLPKLIFATPIKNMITDQDMEISYFQLKDYKHHDTIKAKLNN